MAFVLQLDRHGAARGGVLHRIGHQVEQQLADPVAVHRQQHRRIRLARRHPDVAGLGEEAGGLGGIVHQLAQVGGLHGERGPPLVGARQGEQVLHHLRHLVDLLQRLVERLDALGGRARMGEGPLHAGAQHHERRLQLVARVGGEPVQAREALLQAREHAVHREREAGQLVARERHHHAPVQAPAVLDGVHLVHDRAHRRERVAGQPVGQRHGAEDDDRRDHQHGAQQDARIERAAEERGGDQHRADLVARLVHRDDGEAHPAARHVERERLGRDGLLRGRDLRGELVDRGEADPARRLGEEENVAAAVHHHDVVAERLEVRADARAERRGLAQVDARRRVEWGDRAGIGAHQPPEHPVRVLEPAHREARLKCDPLVELQLARLLQLEVERPGEPGQRQHQRAGVPHGQPAAQRGHVRPSPRSPRPAPCGPASAPAPSRSSSGCG